MKGATLGEANCIINKNIKAPQGLGCQAAAVMVAAGWLIWHRGPGLGRVAVGGRDWWLRGGFIWRWKGVSKGIEVVHTGVTRGDSLVGKINGSFHSSTEIGW